MNYQKLAQTLLRVLGVWLLIQSVQQVSAAIYMVVQVSSRAPSISSSLWTSPLGGGITLAMAIVLLAGSTRFSQLIAGET